jgi:predicted small lipoprotein YifL
MTTSLRLLTAATVLVALSACGNKGPLVHPSRAPDAAAVPTAPASGDPTATPPVQGNGSPDDTAPATTLPPDTAPATPPPPADDSGSHG